MLKSLRSLIDEHVNNNMGIYFFVILFFIIGISAGTFTVKYLGNVQKNDLSNYLRDFFYMIDVNNSNSFTIFKQSVFNNFQTILIIWLLGISIIGTPLIFAVVLMRGLILGFNISFIISEMGLKGIVFTGVTLLPQNIIIIPVIIIVSVLGISYGKNFIKSKVSNYANKNYSLIKKLIGFSSLICLMLGIILIGCAIEAYLSPVLMSFFQI